MAFGGKWPKMAKNGPYMSRTRSSEYFGGSYLVVGEGSHPFSLQGVEFAPNNDFTGEKTWFYRQKVTESNGFAGNAKNGTYMVVGELRGPCSSRGGLMLAIKYVFAGS